MERRFPEGAALLKEIHQHLVAHPRQTKIHNGSYAPFFGVTCVMPLDPQWVTTWGEPLHASLEADPRVTQAFYLLPPSSYHVTLRGLEASMPTATLEDYAAAQFALDEALDEALVSCCPLLFSIAPRGSSSSGILEMVAAQSHEGRLREAEGLLMRGLLQKSLKEQSYIQSWHMTLGYRKDKGDSNSNRVGQMAIDEHIANLFGTDTMPSMPFGGPEICGYRSMCAFVPLFPALQCGVARNGVVST